MQIAILTFDGYNELDSFVAAGILNRLRSRGCAAWITSPADEVTSMNGVTVRAQRPLAFAREADAVTGAAAGDLHHRERRVHQVAPQVVALDGEPAGDALGVHAADARAGAGAGADELGALRGVTGAEQHVVGAGRGARHRHRRDRGAAPREVLVHHRRDGVEHLQERRRRLEALVAGDRDVFVAVEEVDAQEQNL